MKSVRYLKTLADESICQGKYPWAEWKKLVSELSPLEKELVLEQVKLRFAQLNNLKDQHWRNRL